MSIDWKVSSRSWPHFHVAILQTRSRFTGVKCQFDREIVRNMVDETTSQELGSLEPLDREWQAGNELNLIISVFAQWLFFSSKLQISSVPSLPFLCTLCYAHACDTHVLHFMFCRRYTCVQIWYLLLIYRGKTPSVCIKSEKAWIFFTEKVRRK